jgi:Tfp pilus assembly protein PilF
MLFIYVKGLKKCSVSSACSFVFENQNSIPKSEEERMMKSTFILLPVFLLILCGCGKQSDNQQLAQNYYHLAQEELKGENVTSLSYRTALSYIDQAFAASKKALYMASKGTIFFRLGKDRDALRCFKQALGLNPTAKLCGEIFNNMACVLARSGEVRKAEKIWTTLVNDKDYLSPEVALYNQSKVCFARNDIKQAEEKLCQAVTHAPCYIDARYVLSLLYLSQNFHEKASEHLKVILQLAPEHRGAQHLYQRFCTNED